MRKSAMIINVQSVSDVITNSSSEVFILDTDKTLEDLINVLNEVTSGFDKPYKIKTTFGIPEGFENYFFDPKNPFDVVRYKFIQLTKEQRIEFLNSLAEKGKIKKHEYYSDEYKTIGGVEIMSNWTNCIPSYTEYLPCKEIVEALEQPLQDLLGDVEIPFKETKEGQIGKYVLYSESDNSIPYKTWETLETMFNAKRVHLG